MVRNHLLLPKVYPKLKQIARDGMGSYCDGEIKEKFLDIIPVLPHLTYLSKGR